MERSPRDAEDMELGKELTKGPTVSPWPLRPCGAFPKLVRRRSRFQMQRV